MHKQHIKQLIKKAQEQPVPEWQTEVISAIVLYRKNLPISINAATALYLPPGTKRISAPFPD